ncbi:MAG: hypothetical protein HN423_06805 [Alphaproteobacteria bacterium]|nr:hypothetical protein [Alphaproteobacteria bacterium]
MAEKSQHRCHAINGILDAMGGKVSRINQGRADIHQIAKDGKLLRGATFMMASIS